jgi:hypothetical protein
VDNENTIIAHLLKISEDIGSIDAKISNLNNTITKHIDDDEKYQDKTDARLTELEDSQKKVKWLAMGGAVVLSGLFKIFSWFSGNAQ